MGKTHLKDPLRRCVEGYAQFESLSSDEVRKEQMEKYLTRGTQRTHTHTQAFMATSKQSRAVFYQRLKDALETPESDSQKKVLYIDKNHPPNALPDTIRTVKAQRRFG